MRKTFAQVLREGNVDIKNEYDKLYSLLHTKNFNRKTNSLYEIIGYYFPRFHFRGTCLSIEEFNQKYGFNFKAKPDNFDIDYLVSFCEYFYNMLLGLQMAYLPAGIGEMRTTEVDYYFFFEQIRLVIEAIGYTSSDDDGKTIFVEKSPTAIAVSESELIPLDFSYKLLKYDHYSMKGKIEEKKQIIVRFSHILEAKSAELMRVSPSLKDDLFFLFNNMNLRHNNIDPDNKGKYRRFVADLDKKRLEHWYDETYQMCLLAILTLEQAKRKPEFDELKSQIING